MKENYTICNCKKVTYFDIEDALHDHEKFDDVLAAFEDVQKVTHCSTGCGGRTLLTEGERIWNWYF